MVYFLDIYLSQHFYNTDTQLYALSFFMILRNTFIQSLLQYGRDNDLD